MMSGWRSDIENVSIKRLQQFHRDFYWPNNATVSVVGDFDEQMVLDQLQNAFGHIPRQKSHCLRFTQEPEQEGERRGFCADLPGQTGCVCIMWRACAGLLIICLFLH